MRGGNGQIEAEAAFKSLSGRVCFGRWALMKLTHSSSITPERQPSVGLLLLCRLWKQPRAQWNTGLFFKWQTESKLLWSDQKVRQNKRFIARIKKKNIEKKSKMATPSSDPSDSGGLSTVCDFFFSFGHQPITDMKRKRN